MRYDEIRELFWIVVGNIGRRLVEASDSRLRQWYNPVVIFSRLANEQAKERHEQARAYQGSESN